MAHRERDRLDNLRAICGSIRLTEPASALATQTLPAPAATPAAPAGTWMTALIAPVVGSRRASDVIDRPRHPDAALAGRDRARHEPQRGDVEHSARAQIDLEDAPVSGIAEHPQRTLADRHVPHREPRVASRARCLERNKHLAHTPHPPWSGRNSVEVRATRGPQNAAPSGGGAGEDGDAGFPRTRDGVVPRHDPLERSLAVARHIDLSAQRRDVAWFACRREPRQIPRCGIEAPEGAVPEIARPDTVRARRDRTRVRGDRIGRDDPVGRGVDAE